MVKQRRINLQNIFPLINKEALYKVSWGLKANAELASQFREELESQFENIRYIFANSGIKGLIYYDIFDVQVADNCLIFPQHDIKWCFPTLHNKCIAHSAKKTGKIVLQIATLGKGLTRLWKSLEKTKETSKQYYYHGFSVWLTEALAEYHHDIVHKELGSKQDKERYSFGYSLCPDLTMQKDLFSLLNIDKTKEVTLTVTHMMVPEQSTSALIFH